MAEEAAETKVNLSESAAIAASIRVTYMNRACRDIENSSLARIAETVTVGCADCDRLIGDRIPREF